MVIWFHNDRLAFDMYSISNQSHLSRTPSVVHCAMYAFVGGYLLIKFRESFWYGGGGGGGGGG